MLRRKAMDQLVSWKSRPDRKPLLVEGPRQAGKTYIIRVFAAETYETCYELNFLENSSLKKIFSGDLNPNAVLSGIRLSFPEKRYTPGKTLVFLDEIQACPDAVTALKFLAKDPRFDVIASGSSLGMIHGQTASWPVGQIDYLDMWALDFEEFLWAIGLDEDLLEGIKAYKSGKAVIPEAIHQRMTAFLRQYLVIGGMPEVVKTFAAEQDYLAADQIQRQIYRDYTADIAHYAEPEIRLKAQACWNSIPAQLTKVNHKFQYSAVEKKGNKQKFGSSVDWLTAARMVLRVNNVSRVEYPLKNQTMEENYRLYPSDIGLLISTYDFSLKRAFLQEPAEDNIIERNMMEGNLAESIVFRTVRGGIFEALAADMLCKKGYFEKCWFYRNETGTVELEFLVEGPEGVCPIEIKAGNNKTRSLDKILSDDHIALGYKFANQNAGTYGKKISLPLYMLPFI